VNGVRPPRAAPLTRRTARWLDSRVGAAGFARKALDKVFPDHWSFLIGEIAMWSFVIVLVTGTWLTFFYEPSIEEVVYRGSYEPLQGVEVSRAYASALDISFDTRPGWSCARCTTGQRSSSSPPASCTCAGCSSPAPSAGPRELNWVVGVVMLILSIVNGFAGYSLVDDQLSGTGLRIAYNIAISIPVVGTWLASLFFGGEYPVPTSSAGST
jgi:ubiquinol-cytochrome c reductase cytochrome b subunit